MINFLRENRFKAFELTDRDALNRAGGIAVWDLPAPVQRAFNPILFTRTRYLFATSPSQMTRTPRPNPLTIEHTGSSNDPHTLLRFLLPLEQDVTVGVMIAETGRSTVRFKSPLATQDIAGTVTSAFCFFDIEGRMLKQLHTPSQICLLPGATYEDENYMVDADGSVLYVADGVDTARLPLYRASGELAATLSAESFRGITRFDVAAVVRLWFNDSLADSTPGSAAKIGVGFADERLFTRYTVSGIGGVGTSYDFMALNAVAQIGEQAVVAAGEYLTEFRRLRLYEGYPLDYSQLDASKGVVRTPIDGGHLPAAAAVPFVVEPMCVPVQPFYVRWVNRQGGVDYFMFSRRQTRKPSVKSSSTCGVYAADPARAASNLRAWSLTTEHTVTVGADGLSDEEFGPLSKMPFSPAIEWYDGGRWTLLAVSKYDGTFDTGSGRRSFEVTFTLPEINTQF